MRLAIDGLHGAAEVVEDGEASDVGEAIAERAGGQLEVTEAAQEGRGDGLLGKPGEVHAIDIILAPQREPEHGAPLPCVRPIQPQQGR